MNYNINNSSSNLGTVFKSVTCKLVEDSSSAKNEFFNDNTVNHDKIRELLNNFCHIKTNNEIVITYKHFKSINMFIDKQDILNYLILNIENVLNKYETFVIHVNIEKLSLLEIEKNKEFIQTMSSALREKFPDKLDFCIIYEGSFIFKQIYNLLAIFIDKKTLKKIRFQE
jgi:hypothetical protein